MTHWSLLGTALPILQAARAPAWRWQTPHLGVHFQANLVAKPCTASNPCRQHGRQPGDGGGGRRLPLELTDVDVADVAVGSRVEMTFRRLSTADGIHNYFWKARPARA